MDNDTMVNNETNRMLIALMSIDEMTQEEQRQALATELCKRYRNETGLFDTAVQVLKDMDILGEWVGNEPQR